jgi:hypothetical protein
MIMPGPILVVRAGEGDLGTVKRCGHSLDLWTSPSMPKTQRKLIFGLRRRDTTTFESVLF